MDGFNLSWIPWESRGRATTCYIAIPGRRVASRQTRISLPSFLPSFLVFSSFFLPPRCSSFTNSHPSRVSPRVQINATRDRSKTGRKETMPILMCHILTAAPLEDTTGPSRFRVEGRCGVARSPQLPPLFQKLWLGYVESERNLGKVLRVEGLQCKGKEGFCKKGFFWIVMKGNSDLGIGILAKRKVKRLGGKFKMCFF